MISPVAGGSGEGWKKGDSCASLKGTMRRGRHGKEEFSQARSGNGIKVPGGKKKVISAISEAAAVNLEVGQMPEKKRNNKKEEGHWMVERGGKG